MGGDLTSTENESFFHGILYNRKSFRTPAKKMLGVSFLGWKGVKSKSTAGSVSIMDQGSGLIDIGSDQ